MSQILHDVSTDGSGTLLGIMSVFFFLTFVVAAVWGVAGTSRRELEAAANIPFDEEA